MRERLFLIISASSLLLFVAAVSLQIRGIWVQDGYYTHWFEDADTAEKRPGVRYVGLHVGSSRGGLYMMRDTGTYPTPEGLDRTPQPWRHYTKTAQRYPYGLNRQGDTDVRGFGFELSRAEAGYADGNRLESLAVVVPLWPTILLSAILPAIAARHVWLRSKRRRREEQGLCSCCGYDLRASRERCPECGAAVAGG